MIVFRVALKVVAVIVVYYPQLPLLLRLLQALTPQVASTVIVNNGPEFIDDTQILKWPGMVIKNMSSNLGVATALNQGFDWAEQQHADFVVSFDQDSEPHLDMVSKLLHAHRLLVTQGYRVGGVGPARIDPRTGRKASFLFPVNGWRRRFVPDIEEIVSVDHLITSGFLVSLPAWLEVGRYLDELFIDYVDVEWCLRARYQGRQFFVVGAATLVHRIGDQVSTFLGREVPLHSSIRHYTLFRNGVYLQKLAYIQLGWKLVDAFYLGGRLFYYAWTAESKLSRLAIMLRGIFHGYTSRMGRPDLE